MTQDPLPQETDGQRIPTRGAARGQVSAAEAAAPGPKNAKPALVVLDVFEGPSLGQSLEFSRHESLIAGRDSTCQLHFPDDLYFSRFHFRLEVNPPAARLLDLDSRNGTLVNGRKMTSGELKDGDEIRAGRTRIRVHLRPACEPDAAPLATIIGAPEAPGSTTSPTPVNTLSGVSIPGYVLEAEIGRGGLGVVYRAIHKASRRPAAIKILMPSHAADNSAIQLFLREATILSQLRHPRVVRFHEFGAVELQLYIVMELVDHVPSGMLWKGMSWKRRMHVACGIACQVLEGLEYAHSHSYVHRDVKPANILLVRNGRKLNVKLADFGMAKNYMYAGFSDLTDDRDARGTLAFMAPEQVIDCRFARPECDIYSVGATLYYLLSGELPFDFSSGQSALAVILEGKSISLRSRCPAVPLELADIVHRAMARDPDQRFRSSAQMHSVLTACNLP